MPAAFVAAYLSVENQSWSPTGTITCNGVTTGNHLTVLVRRGNRDDFVTGVSDGVNTYTKVDSVAVPTNYDVVLEMWKAYNVTGGNLSVVVTLNGGGSGCSGAVIESSGVQTTSEPLDKYGHIDSGAAYDQQLTIGPVTPTTDGQMCVLVAVGQIDGRPYNDPAGWTRRVDMVASDTYLTAWTYVQPTAAAIGTNILDTTPNNQWMGGILGTFKAGGGGGPTTAPMFRGVG